MPIEPVAAAHNGSATLGADGHSAHFVPEAGCYGFGSFSFTVEGADNVLIVLGDRRICLPRSEALELAHAITAALAQSPDYTRAEPGKARLLRYKAGTVE